MTFDLLIPKANQHIYEFKYVCDQNWVKFTLLVVEIWCSQGFWLIACCDLDIWQHTRHSTDTALLKVTQRHLWRFGRSPAYDPCHLGSVCTFHCVGHSTFVCQLHWVMGHALGWLSSYLHSRYSFVRWCSFFSCTCLVAWLFLMYISCWAWSATRLIARTTAVLTLYCTTVPDSCRRLLFIISMQTTLNCTSRHPKRTLQPKSTCCIPYVHLWLMHNGLQLNPKKSESTEFTGVITTTLFYLSQSPALSLCPH